ncbi:MAG: hypothetical protein UY23_C0001G0351 [Candidatus Jorgensenbacteria bacterium GW2011_GWA1_48_11]|uniref:Uncharacterized protein n=1 Tax=Candidatus Jorgensenbacteria bacterium GW2011_GWA1_48_11 TaxID=1618660 RepID=A0A0G1XBR8_9BACT|nr:MAG: hypothetical protein UY23_C0001G0351 [Candidatus Jorgensenbacteria bacterium GW2011_GWA1_48_11]KKW12236.1 MAG: hypothetical protein UY51_C0005G0478 [Candidatus Jorgensenbacteria bacterium GW2011_GWB1_49_9]
MLLNNIRPRLLRREPWSLSIIYDFLRITGFFFGFGFAGQAQNNEQKKGGEGHCGNGNVAEFQEITLGARNAGGGTRQERKSAELQVSVVNRDEGPDHGQAQNAIPNPAVFFPKAETQNENLRIKEKPLPPAQRARHEAGHLRIKKAAQGRPQGDHESQKQGLAPQKAQHQSGPGQTLKDQGENNDCDPDIPDKSQAGKNLGRQINERRHLLGQGAAGFLRQLVERHFAGQLAPVLEDPGGIALNSFLGANRRLARTAGIGAFDVRQ